LLPDSATFFEKDLDSLQAKFSAFGDQWSDEPSIMKAGQVRPPFLAPGLLLQYSPFHQGGIPSRLDHPRLRTQHDAPDALRHCGFVSTTSSMDRSELVMLMMSLSAFIFNVAVHMQSEHVGFQSGRGWHSNVRDLGPNLQEGVRCCVLIGVSGIPTHS
jgi:hypothetical protein